MLITTNKMVLTKNIMLLTIKLLVIILILLLPYLYIRYRHPFWYSQPVAHYYNILLDRGYITNRITKPMNTNVELIEINTKELIVSSIELLNKNYIPVIIDNLKYQLTKEYFNFTLNTPYKIPISLKNKLKIGMIKNNKLIGLITSRPIYINLYEKVIPIFYVDYLCIEKEYRKQNLVQQLILEMAYRGFTNEFKSFIFRKEMHPLPFSYIANYNTYILDLKKIRNNGNGLWEKMNNLLDNSIIEKCYKFYIIESKKFKLKQIYTIDEFKYYIVSNNFIESYYLLNNSGEIDVLIVLFNNQYILNNSTTLELYLYLKKDNIQDLEILDQLLGNIQQSRYLYINDIGDNNDLINKYIDNIEYSNKNYIHLYNYYDYKINNRDILLSFY